MVSFTVAENCNYAVELGVSMGLSLDGVSGEVIAAAEEGTRGKQLFIRICDKVLEFCC